MKQKLFYGVIVFCILVLVGLALFMYNTPPSIQIQKIIITTDKTEYKQEETVTITIQNKMGKPIKICSLDVVSVPDRLPITIEEYKDNGWVWKFATSYPVDYVEIKESAKKLHTCISIPPNTSLNLKPSMLNEAGIFRTVYYYGEDRTPIHSNEFIIK